MKAVAVLTLSLGLVAAGPFHAEIAARKAEGKLEARQCRDHSGYDPNCHVPGTPNQGVANTIYRVARGRGVSDRVMLATFEAALVESNCNNIDCGHDDSVGVFQQRACVGVWGTHDQIMNVVHATGKFLDAVERCENQHRDWDAGRLAQCAQSSQVPYAYANMRGRAQDLLNKTRALAGNGGGGGGGGGDTTNVGGNPNGGNNGGGTGNCTRSTVRSGETGSAFASRNGVQWSQIVSLNPGLNSSGNNLVANKAYCVKKGSGGTSGGTTGGSNTTNKPPASGKCSKKSTVHSGETGSQFAGRNGLNYSQLRGFNPELNSGGTNLVAGKAYCLN